MSTSAEAISAIVLAGVAILGSIGSVLMLAFRIGRLTGMMEGSNSASLDDRRHLWEDMGKLGERLARHIENHQARP